MDRLKCSSIEIVINTKAIRFFLDKEKITCEMDPLQKKSYYCILCGRDLLTNALQKWTNALSSEINEDCKIFLKLSHGLFSDDHERRSYNAKDPHVNPPSLSLGLIYYAAMDVNVQL